MKDSQKNKNNISALEEISSDFGIGFYMSADIEQPIQLVCSSGDVVLNKYEVDLTGLKVKTCGYPCSIFKRR